MTTCLHLPLTALGRDIEQTIAELVVATYRAFGYLTIVDFGRWLRGGASS